MSALLMAVLALPTAGGAAGGGPVTDAGLHFIELIQQVEPNAWEPAGGAGRIAMFGLLGQARGGGFGAAANGRGNRGDGLVDLIERVVEPDSWDANGGAGRIGLFRQ